MTQPLAEGEYIDLDSGVRVKRRGSTDIYETTVDDEHGTSHTIPLERGDIETLAALAGFTVSG